MHFSNRSHLPRSSGRDSIRLSVKISHLSLGGREPSGIEVMPFERKATISSEGHVDKTEGKVVKLLDERKRMRRLGREVPKLEGREERPVPERSRRVSVLPRERMAGGRPVERGQVSFR